MYLSTIPNRSCKSYLKQKCMFVWGVCLSEESSFHMSLTESVRYVAQIQNNRCAWPRSVFPCFEPRENWCGCARCSCCACCEASAKRRDGHESLGNLIFMYAYQSYICLINGLFREFLETASLVWEKVSRFSPCHKKRERICRCRFPSCKH